MAESDYYFSSGILKGLGKLFFLRVAQVAGDGTAPAQLLGSLVLSGHGGFLGRAEYPKPENSYILGAVLDAARKVLGPDKGDLVDETDLAGFTQSLKLDKTASATGEASFPGAPASAGIGIDYKRLQSVELSFGAGARKRTIPRDLLSEAYRAMAQRSNEFPQAFFAHDRMIVDQVLLVSTLAITVTSSTDFSTDFHAKAEQTNALDVGIKYESKGDRTYTMTLDGSQRYLFGIGGVQADKFH